ncbi:MAG: hypothetical protein Q9M39_06050 [Sulfurovum sp.]|nr:hypothetical protein [Sulfurovum sp.]
MVQDSKFGELISYKLFYNDKLIIEITSEKKEYWDVIYFIELWHNLMADNFDSKDINEFETLIIETSDKDFITYDFQYFISTINHTINSYSNKSYNSTSFLKYIATNEDIAFTKDRLTTTLVELKELGIPIDNKL